MYSVYTFFYASIIFMLAQYIYFRFLDNGKFLNMMHEAVNTLTPTYQQLGMNLQELKDGLEAMTTLGAFQWSFMFMMQNILVGLVLSIFIAMICVKKAKNKEKKI